MPVASQHAALHAAQSSLAQGDAAAARARCHEILSRSPGEAGALHLLGLIAFQEGDGAAAQEYLRRAAESPEASPIYLLSYAELCRKMTDPADALALTRRALALDPRSPLAWYSLGSQLFAAGDHAESRASFERALALDPGLWRADVQLAMLAARRGEIDEASNRFREILIRQSGSGEVAACHAAFLQELGRDAEALGEIERAIELSPTVLEHELRAADIELARGHSAAALARLEAAQPRWPADPRLLASKATLLRLMDRIDDSVALCRDASARGIESPDLLRAGAQALHLAGRDIEALGALDRAAALHPAPAFTEKAVMLTQLGRFSDALEAFERALAHDPTFADALYEKARAKTHAAGDPDIAAMQRLLGRGCSYRDRMLLHFALGKARFEAGDADGALDHWHEGNRLKRTLLDYDAEAARGELESIAATPFVAPPLAASGTRTFGAAAGLAHACGAARDSDLPVFVVGMPRCGSSLIEQILASHPDVHGGGEQMRLRELFAPLALQSVIDPGVAARTAEAALARLRGAGASAQMPRVVDKDLVNFKYLGVIHRVLPNARIIHCRRDPLDTCFSAYTKLFLGDFPYTYDLRELGLYYRAYRSLMDHWREMLPPERFMEIDYEALVNEPEAVTRTLLDFLVLPWNDRCLRFFETPRAVHTASLAQVRRPIYRSSVGQASSMRSRLTPLLEALGPPPASEPHP